MVRRILMATIVMTAVLILATGCNEDKSEQKDVGSQQKNQSQEEAKGEQAKMQEQSVKVMLQTTKGDIVIELDEEKAPVTVKNFLSYVNDGFYDGLIFHRIIAGFMIQGGGFTDDMRQKQSTYSSIVNESDNGLHNDRGTIAMARTSDPNSATSQFFINHRHNRNLDFQGPGSGYAVFGKVVEGMDVVDAIAVVETTRKSGYSDVPVEPIVIKSAKAVAK